MKFDKRAYCGNIDESHVDKSVVLMGWVDAIRDHGNLLFIHLRDISGIIQIVFSSERNKDIYHESTHLKEEYIIEVTGLVAMREKGTENPNLNNGTIEVFAEDLQILSRSRPLPFQITEKAMIFGEEIQSGPETVDEDLRLTYRYLDLRRPSMQEIFIKRYEILKCIREYLDELNFIEIETPFLTRSTPEGARDYLVPSRVHHGKFYALPQSPQLFKQLLMMSGMDRYFQIARCFRDEDLRPNRQPEFTQLDLEASFIDEEFIYEIIEELTVRIFSIGGIDLPRPFSRMTYQMAMDRYGTDRPDLRFDMSFKELTDILKNTEYTIFRQILERNGLIKGFCVKDQATRLSKNVLQNEYALKIVPSLGAKGMTWMKVIDGKLDSNIVQFFKPDEQEMIIKLFDAQEGDVILMIADVDHETVNKVLGKLRLHIAERLDIISEDVFTPLWVTDFPLFELKDDGIGSQHHPFTMPNRTDFDPNDIRDLLSINSRAYDLVMNGEELGGGSIRIHDMNLQKKIFQTLGLSNQQAEKKFGFFLKALEFGAPPHGGLALGMDRVIAMILNVNSIRDVISFPKNRRAFCPLTKAPADADSAQLEELGLGSSSIDRIDRGLITDGTDSEFGLKRDIRHEAISKEEVYHVAKLARLTLSEPEIESYQKDLNSILNYVETLREVDTEEVSPMSHVLEMLNIWRDDKPTEGKKTDDLLSNAPDREKDFFRVPRIIEET